MAATEVLWIKSLLHELVLSPSSVPTLWCDNHSATALAYNPKFHSKTKYIKLDVHFIREKFVANNFQVQYISSSDQTTIFSQRHYLIIPSITCATSSTLLCQVEHEGDVKNIAS